MFGVSWGLSVSQEIMYFPALCVRVADPVGMPKVHTVGKNEGSGGNRVLYGSKHNDIALKMFLRYKRGKLAS